MSGRFHPDALIFDAEGVVVDTEVLWDKSQEILLARRGLPYDRDYLKPRMAGGTVLKGAKIMIDYFGLDDDPATLAKEREKIIQQLFETDIHFIPGFIEFLQFVKSKGLKHCIATSMQKTLMIKVNKKLHLDELFENRIYHIEDVNNVAKPHPDIFLYAAERLQTAPERCMVIEDSPNGIKAARSAGMHAVGLATTFKKEFLEAADFIALDFHGLTAYLDGLI
jgi:HAD superfamily hydrolase (TIGR01509 family)